MQSFSIIKTAITNKAISEKTVGQGRSSGPDKSTDFCFWLHRAGNLTGDSFICDSSAVRLANDYTLCSFSNFLCLYQERKGKVQHTCYKISAKFNKLL